MRLTYQERELPGTPPDGFSFVGAEPADTLRDRFVEACDKWRVDGMTHMRATQADDGIYLDVWRTRPEREAAFDPPTTLTPPDESA